MTVAVVMHQPLEWVNRQITEAELQKQVLLTAKTFGWESFHPKFSWKSRGGYPDLTLWSPDKGGVIWVELKSEAGKLTSVQEDTITSMRKAGLTVHVWRPSDWPTIVEVLSHGRVVGAR